MFRRSSALLDCLVNVLWKRLLNHITRTLRQSKYLTPQPHEVQLPQLSLQSPGGGFTKSLRRI